MRDGDPLQSHYMGSLRSRMGKGYGNTAYFRPHAKASGSLDPGRGFQGEFLPVYHGSPVSPPVGTKGRSVEGC